MHHIVTERTSVFGAIFVGVETTEYLGTKVGIVEFHFNFYSNLLLTKLKYVFCFNYFSISENNRVLNMSHLQVALLVPFVS